MKEVASPLSLFSLFFFSFFTPQNNNNNRHNFPAISFFFFFDYQIQQYNTIQQYNISSFLFLISAAIIIFIPLNVAVLLAHFKPLQLCIDPVCSVGFRDSKRIDATSSSYNRSQHQGHQLQRLGWVKYSVVTRGTIVFHILEGKAFNSRE